MLLAVCIATSLRHPTSDGRVSPATLRFCAQCADDNVRRVRPTVCHTRTPAALPDGCCAAAPPANNTNVSATPLLVSTPTTPTSQRHHSSCPRQQHQRPSDAQHSTSLSAALTRRSLHCTTLQCIVRTSTPHAHDDQHHHCDTADANTVTPTPPRVCGRIPCVHAATAGPSHSSMLTPRGPRPLVHIRVSASSARNSAALHLRRPCQQAEAVPSPLATRRDLTALQGCILVSHALQPHLGDLFASTACTHTSSLPHRAYADSANAFCSSNHLACPSSCSSRSLTYARGTVAVLAAVIGLRPCPSQPHAHPPTTPP